MSYVVKTTETFEKNFKKHHSDKKDRLKSVKEKLSNYPDKYGKPLRGELHGTWQIRFGKSFRIWYEINEEKKTVILKAVYHKDDIENMS